MYALAHLMHPVPHANEPPSAACSSPDSVSPNCYCVVVHGTAALHLCQLKAYVTNGDASVGGCCYAARGRGAPELAFACGELASGRRHDVSQAMGSAADGLVDYTDADHAWRDHVMLVDVASTAAE